MCFEILNYQEKFTVYDFSGSLDFIAETHHSFFAFGISTWKQNS